MNIIKPAALLLAAGALVAGSAAAASAAAPDTPSAPDGTRVTAVDDRDVADPANRDFSTPAGTRVTGGYHPDGTRVTGVQPDGTRVT